MIRIFHAFDSLMNLYGEYGNVSMLERALKDAGEEVEVITLKRLEGFDPDSCGFLYIGAGTEGAAAAACTECAEQKDRLSAYAERGGLALLTGTAPALFGKGVVLNGMLHEGAGVLDVTYKVTPGKRSYSEFIMSCDEISDSVVGAISTSSEIISGETPFFTARFDAAGILHGTTEGAKKDGIYASELIGPLLARNPALLNFFAAKIAGHEIEVCPESAAMGFAKKSFESVLATLIKEQERACKRGA